MTTDQQTPTKYIPYTVDKKKTKDLALSEFNEFKNKSKRISGDVKDKISKQNLTNQILNLSSLHINDIIKIIDIPNIYKSTNSKSSTIGMNFIITDLTKLKSNEHNNNLYIDDINIFTLKSKDYNVEYYLVLMPYIKKSKSKIYDTKVFLGSSVNNLDTMDRKSFNQYARIQLLKPYETPPPTRSHSSPYYRDDHDRYHYNLKPVPEKSSLCRLKFKTEININDTIYKDYFGSDGQRDDDEYNFNTSTIISQINFKVPDPYKNQFDYEGKLPPNKDYHTYVNTNSSKVKIYQKELNKYNDIILLLESNFLNELGYYNENGGHIQLLNLSEIDIDLINIYKSQNPQTKVMTNGTTETHEIPPMPKGWTYSASAWKDTITKSMFSSQPTISITR